MTFNFAQNHVAKTKVRESDSNCIKSAATGPVKLRSVPCVSLYYVAEVAAVVINTFRPGLSLLITVGSEEILTDFQMLLKVTRTIILVISLQPEFLNNIRQLR